jgi:hypothetical protein
VAIGTTGFAIVAVWSRRRADKGWNECHVRNTPRSQAIGAAVCRGGAGLGTGRAVCARPFSRLHVLRTLAIFLGKDNLRTKPKGQAKTVQEEQDLDWLPARAPKAEQGARSEDHGTQSAREYSIQVGLGLPGRLEGRRRNSKGAYRQRATVKVPAVHVTLRVL